MPSSSAQPRFYRLRLLIGTVIITALPGVLMIGSNAASASVISGARGVITLPGGMVRASEASIPLTTPVVAANTLPKCAPRIEYKGKYGYIAVQERNHKLQWGIVMTPYSYSIGKWNVSTYLSGKKTPSGFNRTVTTPYTPHGSIAVPADKVFHVMAKLVNQHGTFVNLPNACTT